MPRPAVPLLLLLLALPLLGAPTEPPSAPAPVLSTVPTPTPGATLRTEPKVVRLEPGENPYLLIVGGPPETRTMKSGLVTIAPGGSIGKHDTKANEEILLPLEGEGELRFEGRPPVSIRPGVAVWTPSHTAHDVVNTGKTRLRYVFVVARAE